VYRLTVFAGLVVRGSSAGCSCYSKPFLPDTLAVPEMVRSVHALSDEERMGLAVLLIAAFWLYLFGAVSPVA
jgi:hypothetical protein